MKKFIISALILISTFSIGFIAGLNKKDNGVPVISGKSAVVSNLILRDVKKMDRIELENELYHFYNDEFKIDYYPIKNNPLYTHKIETSLYERNGNQFIKMKCHQSENWNMYFSIAGASLVIGGVIAYKIFKN